MKKLATLFLILAAVGNLFLVAPAQVSANACDDLDQTFNRYGGKPNLPRICTTGEVVQRVLNIAFSLIATFTVIFIIIGGYRYMTSGGNSEQAGKGKQTVLYALAGLVVVVVAATVVNLVINAVVNNQLF